MWSRDVQNVIFAILLCGWLGGFDTSTETGKLFTIEEVGQIMNGVIEYFMTCHATLLIRIQFL